MIITTGNPVSLTTVEHRNQTAALLPPANTALAVRGGIHSGLGISKTSGMSFTIAPGRAIITPASPSAGPYTVTVIDPETLTFAPGDASRDRIDIVAIKVNESAEVADAASIVILQGAYPAAGLPVAPTVPAGHEPLFSVPIGAGLSAGTGGWQPSTATDLRHQLAAIGAWIPVNSEAERDALLPYNGLTVMRLDLGGSVDRYVNGRWRGNTDWIYCDFEPGWRPAYPDPNDYRYNLSRLRCKVVGDGTLLSVWGEVWFGGTGTPTTGAVIGKIPKKYNIKPSDFSWVPGTGAPYTDIFVIRLNSAGEISLGPGTSGKSFWFQGIVPLELT